MRFGSIVIAVLLLVAALAHAEADLVITGGRVLTQDAAQPQAEAVAVSGGRITAVGSAEQVLRERGPGTEVIDAHGHPVSGASKMDDCSLADKPLDVTGITAVARGCLAQHALASGEWLVIRHLNPAAFDADAAALDAVVADRPLALLGSDGHTSWVNTRALALTGITKDTPEPATGRITRRADGTPTGHFVDGGQARLYELLPKLTVDDKVAATERAFRLMQAAGITTVMDASVNADELEVYKRLADAGKLVPRVAVALEADVARGAASIEEMKGWRARYAGVPRLSIDTVKIFADGVLEYPTQSAALIEPYLDAHGKPTTNRGGLYVEPKAFASFVEGCTEAGLNVHVHAIGDGAVRATLDAFEAARATAAGKRARFSIAHLQLIDPADWGRFAKLGVFASFQLLWAQANQYSIEAVEPYIGPRRMQLQYPARGVMDAGGSVVGGSDWSVSSFNPFEAIEIAHTRRNPEDPARPPLVPAQAMPVDAMLRAYTIEAARMLGMEQDIGSISVGKAADIVLLDRDPLAADTVLRQTRVLGTLIDGKWVHRDRQERR
jgi:predicted amidohydrolase YtcJ